MLISEEIKSLFIGIARQKFKGGPLEAMTVESITTCGYTCGV